MPAFPAAMHRLALAASLLGALLCGSAVPSLAAARAGEAPAAGTEEDPLTAALVAEYALQAGKLEEAARWFLQAAEGRPGDVALAERAARDPRNRYTAVLTDGTHPWPLQKRYRSSGLEIVVPVVGREG